MGVGFGPVDKAVASRSAATRHGTAKVSLFAENKARPHLPLSDLPLLAVSVCKRSSLDHQEVKHATSICELLDHKEDIGCRAAKMILSRSAVTKAEATLLAALTSTKLTKPERKKRIDVHLADVEEKSRLWGEDIKSHCHEGLLSEALALSME